MKITSQRQARFLGAIAGGNAVGRGPSPMKARLMLRENKGMKMASLPERAPERISQRTSKRGIRRGGR